MATVTALEYQKRRRDRVNLYLDGRFAIGLSATLAAGLKVGQQLSPEQLNVLEQQEQLENGKEAAIRFLGYRPRSAAEVQRHLKKKGLSEDAIEQIEARLVELDLLDDAAFVDYWIEQRRAFKPRSRFALRQELRQKGIADELIQEALAHVDETDMARRAAETRAHRWAGLPEAEFLARLGQFLQRRGFSYGVVQEVATAYWTTLNQES